MRTPIIAANWKMNFTVEQARSFVRSIRNDLNAVTAVKSVICPPAIDIPTVYDVLQGTNVGVGAQNMYYEESGAFTGEIAPPMITPFCEFVILGHSERRALFGETDEAVNRKAHAALAHKLTPIICVGESLEQNEAGETHAFVSGQVRAALDGLSAEQVGTLVIAYEPIWAIGTGKAASADDAGNIIGSSVRDVVRELFGDGAAENVRVQYGGSTNPQNIVEFMRHPDIDGALVGGASLKPNFAAMVSRTADLYQNL
ncbi:MAG TPA: triose-phosphate isomerase [Candidatus Binatia bacterium]|jgi:triosephosphate isomerase|nr:triose-phosphate isomerase [Candidatus Binatia bacterium]